MFLEYITTSTLFAFGLSAARDNASTSRGSAPTISITLGFTRDNLRGILHACGNAMHPGNKGIPKHPSAAGRDPQRRILKK